MSYAGLIQLFPYHWDTESNMVSSAAYKKVKYKKKLIVNYSQ